MIAKESSVRIRRARLGDEGAIDHLYGQLHGKDYVCPGLPKMRRALDAILRKRDETLLIAVKQGRVVGAAHILIFRHLGRALRPVAIVENVVVDRAARRSEIGGQLMKAAVEIAQRKNCYKVSLTTNRKRGDAHRFYGKLGWHWTHLGFTFPLKH